MKYKGHRTSIQNHAELADRLNRMANAIRRKHRGDMPAEELVKVVDLEQQASEHSTKAMLTGAIFTMVL